MNKQITFVVFVFLALFMISSVSAIVAVVSPANNTNQTGTVTFDVTFVNGTDIWVTAFTQAGVNASFYTVVNGTPSVSPVATSTSCVNSSTNVSCVGTMTITSANDGMYNITALIMNATGTTAGSVTNTSNVRFDTTAPNISFQGQTPVSGANLSQTSLAVNISSVDAGVGLDTIRIFLYNSSWGLVNNTNTTANARLINFTGLNSSVYHVNVTTNDTIGNVNSTQVSRTITLDTNASAVSSSDIVSPLNYGNYSTHTGAVTLNVSVSESLTNITSVFFNITNSSGVQNATVTAAQEGTSSYYVATLNTSDYPDGLYNVTVYTNDSAGNVNNSAVVTTVRIDNTNPVITFSCDRTTLRTGEVITCTCSATDAVSGVNSTSYTALPSTSAGGSYTTTCTVNDYAGNEGSADWAYSVTGGGSSSGGAASQSWTNNYAYDSKELSEQSALTTLLSAKNKVTIKVAGTSHYVGVKSVGLTSAELEMASTPVQFTLNVGDTKKFDLNTDGSYDVSVVLNNIVSGRANVTINSINEKIVSTSAGGASPAASGDAAAPAVAVQSDESESGSSTGVWVGAVVLIIVIVLVVVFVKKSKRHR